MDPNPVQEAVREVESAAGSIIEPRRVSDAGLWETDLETGETTLDPSLERLYGFEPGTWDGSYEDWAELVHPEDLPAVQQAWERAVENGEPYQIVFRIVRPYGVVRWIDSRARMITDDDGTPVKIQGLNADITESQERIKALQVLDRVLRHNLRNDMTVIKGHAEMIAEAGSEEMAAHGEQILRKADQLLATATKQRTIGNLLLSESQVERLDLVGVVERAVEGVREEFPDASVTLTTPESAPITAVSALEEAVGETVRNALVHNDSDAPAVEVRIDVDGNVTRLRVADNGPGIPEGEREIVTGQREVGPLEHASGLGLWLVSWAVERSGGTLSFEDNDPGGTVVVIDIPGTSADTGA